MADRSSAFEDTAHRRAFGDRVRLRRAERELTQEQLAERAHVHRSYLAAVESGLRNPTLDVIVKISRGLDMPVSHLFD